MKLLVTVILLAPGHVLVSIPGALASVVRNAWLDYQLWRMMK